MTQDQMNALTPVEGMIVFNTDAHKVQVYGMITDNAEILNEIYTGTATYIYGNNYQTFTPPISGQVVAIEVLAENASGGAGYINIMGVGISIPANSSFVWYTANLTTPFNVNAGTSSYFFVDNYGGSQLATNSFYPNGSGCCFPGGADDLLFRIHIQPTPGSYGWQNLN